MKEENNWFHRDTKNYKRILWTVICQQIGRPRRNGQISRDIQPSKTESEIDNLNRPITSIEIESVIIIKKLSTN